MKKMTLCIALAGITCSAMAQSKTTEALQSKFDDALSLYFYKNTLRMLNQSESKEFDELIKNIEKLKFLMVDKGDKNFGSKDYKKLTDEYKAESYEPIMTSRYEGKNFDIYFNDKRGSSPGTVVLVNDSSRLFVLDMIGTINVSRAGELFSMIDGSSDIGEKIKDFTRHRGPRNKKGFVID